MLDELFTFPIVMIDGDNEERKVERKLKNRELLNNNDDELGDYDIVFGEAEYPYYDFIGVEDRWLPRDESFQKAMDGKFEACIVRFLHAGQLLVPWSKKKFKAELTKFSEQYETKYPKESPKKAELRILTLTPEQYKKATEDDAG